MKVRMKDALVNWCLCTAGANLAWAYGQCPLSPAHIQEKNVRNSVHGLLSYCVSSDCGRSVYSLAAMGLFLARSDDYELRSVNQKNLCGIPRANSANNLKLQKPCLLSKVCAAAVLQVPRILRVLAVAHALLHW